MDSEVVEERNPYSAEFGDLYEAVCCLWRGCRGIVRHPGDGIRSADPAYKPAIAAAVYNWTGFYVGANIGAEWTGSTLTNFSAGTNWNFGETGFIGGVQAGYNRQAGNILIGIEGEFDWAASSGIAGPTSTRLGVLQATANTEWIGTVAARFGVTSNRLLIYSKLGGAWVQGRSALNIVNGGEIWAGSHTNGGWLMGAGIEYAFASNWTGKLEYNFMRFSNASVSTPPVGSQNRDLQMLKAGLNYQLGERTSGTVESGGGTQGTEALAQAAQNPIANMISLPLQNNTNFNVGPFRRTQDVLNIQPVIPMTINSEWNIISRTIVPLVSQPSSAGESNTYGIGDITQSLFFSPTHPGSLIWGIGPVYTMPSASDPILGAGKVLAGPTAVALVTPGHWVIGILVNNQWSIGGDPSRPPVNTFLAQPFVNYNMAGGWFLTYSPIITANWYAPSGQQWTVPIGGGVGRVFKVDGQAYNASVQAYYNAVRPSSTADWNLRLSIALLFPK